MEAAAADLRVEAEQGRRAAEQRHERTEGVVNALAEDLRGARLMHAVETDALRTRIEETREACSRAEAAGARAQEAS